MRYTTGQRQKENMHEARLLPFLAEPVNEAETLRGTCPHLALKSYAKAHLFCPEYEADHDFEHKINLMVCDDWSRGYSHEMYEHSLHGASSTCDQNISHECRRRSLKSTSQDPVPWVYR